MAPCPRLVPAPSPSAVRAEPRAGVSRQRVKLGPARSDRARLNDAHSGWGGAACRRRPVRRFRRRGDGRIRSLRISSANGVAGSCTSAIKAVRSASRCRWPKRGGGGPRPAGDRAGASAMVAGRSDQRPRSQRARRPHQSSWRKPQVRVTSAVHEEPHHADCARPDARRCLGRGRSAAARSPQMVDCDPRRGGDIEPRCDGRLELPRRIRSRLAGEALDAGRAVLARAAAARWMRVKAAIPPMEDLPLFNAGRGAAVFTWKARMNSTPRSWRRGVIGAPGPWPG